MKPAHRLSDRGRTIVFSIHQPRYSIYRVFDSMVLLSGGETVYHGPCGQALDYFETLGMAVGACFVGEKWLTGQGVQTGN